MSTNNTFFNLKRFKPVYPMKMWLIFHRKCNKNCSNLTLVLHNKLSRIYVIVNFIWTEIICLIHHRLKCLFHSKLPLMECLRISSKKGYIHCDRDLMKCHLNSGTNTIVNAIGQCVIRFVSASSWRRVFNIQNPFVMCSRFLFMSTPFITNCIPTHRKSFSAMDKLFNRKKSEFYYKTLLNTKQNKAKQKKLGQNLCLWWKWLRDQCENVFALNCVYYYEISPK